MCVCHRIDRDRQGTKSTKTEPCRKERFPTHLITEPTIPERGFYRFVWFGLFEVIKQFVGRLSKLLNGLIPNSPAYSPTQ